MSDSVSTSAIGAALEANLIEQVRFYAKSSFTIFFDDKDMVRFISGLPSSILNLIAGAKLSHSLLDTQIHTALDPFRKHNVPMIWWVGPTTKPENLGDYLLEQGLKKNFDMLGMFYDLRNLEEDLALPPEFSYKLVNNDDLLKLWAETESKAFEADPSSTKYIYNFEKSLGFAESSPWLRYIGFIEKEPVAVSILFQAAGVAAVFNVATIPRYRRQGIGTIMTKIPLLQGKLMGYNYGVLKASPMGTYLYRKMDFKECCKIGLYYLPLEIDRVH